MRNFVAGLVMILLFHASLFAYSGENTAEVSPRRITYTTTKTKKTVQPIILFQPGCIVVGNTSFNQDDQNGFIWGEAKVE